jgi:hypothetical protein
MATTYEAIATVTVGSGGAANIEFTSIPGTYTDLSLLCTLRLTSGGIEAVDFTFNNDTGANYSWRYIQGSGSAVNSASGSAANAFTEAMVTNGSTSTASTFSNSCLYIPNYAGSNNKSFSLDTVEEENATAAYMRLEAGLWSNSAAITSIKIYGSANFAQYSTATLYGIKNS